MIRTNSFSCSRARAGSLSIASANPTIEVSGVRRAWEICESSSPRRRARVTAEMEAELMMIYSYVEENIGFLNFYHRICQLPCKAIFPFDMSQIRLLLGLQK